MGICASRSLNSEITSSSGRHQNPKVPHTSTTSPAKNKGPLYDSHLAHTAYMNNVAKARRSTGAPHSSQLLKPQHLLRRKPPTASPQCKKNTSPVRCILTNQNKVTAEFINYENMDLFGNTDHDKPTYENFNIIEESKPKCLVHPLQSICDTSDKASSGCNTDRSNKLTDLAHNSLSRELGTLPEVQQKHSAQDLNQKLEPIFSLIADVEAISCNNNDIICNNGDLNSLCRNNATQTSPSPSKISNHSFNSYDDSEVMKSVKFPRETAIYYMMHSEEVIQEFSAKKRHGFCRNNYSPEETSQPSLTARDCRSFQKRRQSKCIALESGKEFHHPLRHCVNISEVHYHKAEKPLLDDVIKEESAEQMENRSRLNIGDGADESIDTEAHYRPEKRSSALEKTSSICKNDDQRDVESHDRELSHSEHDNTVQLDDMQIAKILWRKEMVGSDHSGCLSCNSCEYQSKEMENEMRGKSELRKSTSLPTSRRSSELSIPLDQVLHEQELRHQPGSCRNKPTNVGPNAALTKFHAHGDGFIRPRQYLAQTFCSKHEEELELTGLHVSNREGTTPRHRSRHDRSRRVAPRCPPSSICSGVYSTEDMRSKMLTAELNEDSPLLTGCIVRSPSKPASLPSVNNQEEAIGEPHSNRTTIPEETTDIDDDHNKCTDLKHAPSLRIYTRLRNDDGFYEEANKLKSEFELKQNTAKVYGTNSADMESSSAQTSVNNRSAPTSARMSTREAYNASESGESASSRLMQKTTEDKNKKCSHSSRRQKETDFRHLLMNEPQPKCKTHEATKSSLHKHQSSENQSIMNLISDAQEEVSQYDTEKSSKKQYENSDTAFLTENQHQNVTHDEAHEKSTLRDKGREHSIVLEHSEQLAHLEKPVRESLKCNTYSQSRSLQHEVDDHHQLSAPEPPQRQITAFHCRITRENAATSDPSTLCGPSPQSAQTVVNIESSFHHNKHDVSKNYQPTRDSQHQYVVHQEPERDDEEQIFHQHLHTSRVRYCPIHRQHVELPQEEDHIPSLHYMNSELCHPRRHHFQPWQHYCTIHHRMFTLNMTLHEDRLPQNIRTMTSEKNEITSPRMPSHMDENQSDVRKRSLSSMQPRCRNLVAMFERQKDVILSGRNWKDEEDHISAAMNGVNGVNGHHGELNGGGDLINSQNAKGCWTIGLINSKFRYLTAETFGFKINANGASLKKKQVWTLEPTTGDSAIMLRSHLDKYLAVDTFGNVTCETEERDDPGTKFQISVADDSTGRWALRNITRGYFLGASSDKLTCTAKVPGDAELWHVHLAARPQVNLRSVGRKRFAHLSENLDEIHVDANIPWGEDTLFTLEFRVDDNGKYALHTCNNKYLSREGKLVDTCTPNCLFSAEYHAGQLALRDRTGAYLSPIGSKAVLKSRSTSVTKDELFSLEDSLPQASFVAGLNSRYVSVKQGVDVTANQDEISDHETFQLEFDSSTKRWYIRTMQDRYWTLETGGGIQASGDKRSSNALFDLVWQGDGSVAFRANNGKFVSTKRSGHLYANCDNVEDNSKYFFYLINRPILVLKCEQGFVGYKSASSPKLECNKATYETIQVERSEKGVVFFKGQNGKYWHVDGESVTADTDVPEGFFIELRDPTHICIKSTSGEYLVASKNGAFRLGDSDYENATKWEY